MNGPSRLRRFAHTFYGLLVVQYAAMLEYRAELVLWALSNSLSFILMGVWFEASGRGGLALAPLDVVRYFLAVFILRQLTVVWVVWEFEQDVQSGKFSSFLLTPIDPVWRYLSAHLAERIARLPFSALLVGLFFALYPQSFFVPQLQDVLWMAVFVVMAFLVRFALQYTLGMSLFWTERATSFEMLLFVVYMFLSGAMAPLDVFPAAVRDIVMLTPFPYLVWVPARILIGGDVGIDRMAALGVCSAWLLALFVVNRVLWRLGLARHGAQGG